MWNLVDPYGVHQQGYNKIRQTRAMSHIVPLELAEHFPAEADIYIPSSGQSRQDARNTEGSELFF